VCEVAQEMSARGHGSVAVIEGRRLVGLITERDVVRAVAAGIDATSEQVRTWMSVDPDVFDIDVDVFEAAEWLLESGYRHLPVESEGEVLGVVSLRDLLSAIVSSVEEE